MEASKAQRERMRWAQRVSGASERRGAPRRDDRQHARDGPQMRRYSCAESSAHRVTAHQQPQLCTADGGLIGHCMVHGILPPAAHPLPPPM